VRPDYRDAGYGERLVRQIEGQARARKLKKLFVLTTRATHWFIERGFAESAIDKLPKEKKDLYNYQRRSKVLVKSL
jgi:amino-acid N-acetyltransferase